MSRRAQTRRARLPLLLGVGLVSACGGGPGANDNQNSNANQNGNANQDECVASAEIPDNAIDEDCDGWLATSAGVAIRAARPRVLISPEGLHVALDRMRGPNAREPYSRWLQQLIDAEDGGDALDLLNLALVYRATEEPRFRDAYLARIPGSGDPTLTELLSLDLMWDEVDDAVKRGVMDRVAANPDVWYWDSTGQSQRGEASWGYHSAHGVAPALAYAGLFACTDLEQMKDPAVHPFDAVTYLGIVAEELSDTGHFRQMENRVAGDPAHNDALPGEPGGMYDNFGYDSSEESYSVNVLAEYRFLTGEDRFTGHLHDQYRARFYQNLQYPHLFTHYDTDQWCRRAGTEAHVEARIWDTQTDWITQPRSSAVPLTAWLYGDERMQHYVEQGRQTELCGAPYDGMAWDLLFRRDDLVARPPTDNPSAMYFSGPGLVAMREDWSTDATFAVFVAGEGISRRYEDACSFLIHRKGNVFPHAGARIRNNPDNARHHWYHIRSIAKNTLKVFDPDECLDLDESDNRGPLHSGTPLVPSDNMGGQMFETQIATQDLDYPISSGGLPGRTSNPNDPLGLYETANVIKFEHVDGQYTYAVGDGAAAYTRKVELFERELLYLRPDVFVIFDRVRTPDASFRKVWTVHTVDRPEVADAPVETAQGMRAFTDVTAVEIPGARNVTSIVPLLPAQNRVVIRGGDTVLAAGLALRSGAPVGAGQVTDSDHPRWLEIFAVGPDTQGTLTITGDAEEGAGVSEDVVFDGTVQVDVSSVPTEAVTATTLVDATQSWTPDQWAGYLARVRCGGSSESVMIAGNDATTLRAAFTPCASAWAYSIERPVANTYTHFTRITGITTADMDVENLTLSVPHYFDATDALGRVHSFSPHTDGRDDQYRKRFDLGQYTVEIQPTQPQTDDVFLTVIHLRDPGVPCKDASRLEAAEAAGAVVGSQIAIFARGPAPLDALSIAVPHTAPLAGWVFDLQPETDYWVLASGDTLALSQSDNGGARATSSAMGVLPVTIP